MTKAELSAFRFQVLQQGAVVRIEYAGYMAGTEAHLHQTGSGDSLGSPGAVGITYEVADLTSFHRSQVRNCMLIYLVSMRRRFAASPSSVRSRWRGLAQRRQGCSHASRSGPSTRSRKPPRGWPPWILPRRGSASQQEWLSVQTEPEKLCAATAATGAGRGTLRLPAARFLAT